MCIYIYVYMYILYMYAYMCIYIDARVKGLEADCNVDGHEEALTEAQGQAGRLDVRQRSGEMEG